MDDEGENIMKDKKTKIFFIGFIACLVLLSLIASVYTFLGKKVNNQIAEINPEIKMSMQYEQITEENREEYEKVDNIDFVKFSTPSGL